MRGRRKGKKKVHTGIRREQVDQRDEGCQLEERDGSTVDQPAAEKAAGTSKANADELVYLGVIVVAGGGGVAAAAGDGDWRGCDGLPGLRG